VNSFQNQLSRAGERSEPAGREATRGLLKKQNDGADRNDVEVTFAKIILRHRPPVPPLMFMMRGSSSCLARPEPIMWGGTGGRKANGGAFGTANTKIQNTIKNTLCGGARYKKIIKICDRSPLQFPPREKNVGAEI